MNARAMAQARDSTTSDKHGARSNKERWMYPRTDNTDNTRRVLITALVTSLTAGGLAACNTSTNYRNGAFTTGDNNTLADQASININPENTKGEFTNDWYNARANEVALPGRFVAEAQHHTAASQARRAAAQAGLAIADANRFKQLSAQDADLAAATANRDKAEAAAYALNGVYNAKLEEINAQAEAAIIANEIAREYGNATVENGTLQWQSEHEQMHASATKNWTEAQANHERMLAERQFVESEGVATIAQMQEVARQTAQRAAQRVAALRAEARAIQIQTAAREDALDANIDNTEDRFFALGRQWREFAENARTEADAHVDELESEIQRLSTQSIDEKHRLDMLGAELEYERTLARARQAELDAAAQAQDNRAEIDSLRAEARKTLSLAQAAYEEELGAIERMIERGEADIARKRAQADRIERQARAEFVKAEAAARADAIRETSRHQSQLSEKELALIEAEARAEAARIQEDLYTTLARQRSAGRHTLPGNNDPQNPGAHHNDENPAFASANIKPDKLEPSRVADFKTALAESASIRKTQNASEASLYASAEERTTRADAWFDQQVAQHENAVADVIAHERTTNADVNELYANANETIANAEAERERAITEAGAQRDQTLAQIVRLGAQVSAVETIADAEVTEYLARAEAADNIGESEVRHLEVALQSTGVRGEAEANRFLAEAQATQDIQFAVVSQMRQEIATAERVLDAELAKLDRAAESYIAIAEADFNQALAEADAFADISEARITQVAANNQADLLVGEAKIAFLNNVQDATQLAAAAEVDRVRAEAADAFGSFVAQNTIDRAKVNATHKMAVAEANEFFAVADADDHAVRARFDAHIARVEAQRNEAYANRYLNQQQQLAAFTQAQAAAASFADISAEARANLAQRTQEFNRMLQQEWDERLATLPNFPVTNDGQIINYITSQFLNTPGYEQQFNTNFKPGFNPAFDSYNAPAFVNEPIDIDN